MWMCRYHKVGWTKVCNQKVTSALCLPAYCAGGEYWKQNCPYRWVIYLFGYSHSKRYNKWGLCVFFCFAIRLRLKQKHLHTNKHRRCDTMALVRNIPKTSRGLRLAQQLAFSFKSDACRYIAVTFLFWQIPTQKQYPGGEQLLRVCGDSWNIHIFFK